MSIPNIIHKIKSKSGIDKNTILYLSIIVGVGISAFGLGRLSLDNNINNIKNENITILDLDKLPENQYSNDNEIYIEQSFQQEEKMYVASKNGKMYYSLGCSGAKRIKVENQIWFRTSEDAEKSGYTKASSC